MMKWIWVFLTATAFAQTTLAGPGRVVGPSTIPLAVAGGGTFSLIHSYAFLCGGGSNACTKTITSTGTGHQILVFGQMSDGTPTDSSLMNISSVTLAGNTFTHPTTCFIAANAASNVVSADGWYTLSSVSGATSITVNWVNVPAGHVGDANIQVFEYAYTGPSASFDISNTVNDAACTTCASPTLSGYTGTNDMIVNFIADDTLNTGMTARTGASYTQPAFQSANGEAGVGAINTITPGSLTWTQLSSDVAVGCAIALKGN